jgi:1-deoxy-D-xylulose-5-phosphate synthase
MIIVLNDNKMSISPNVGAFSNYLARLRLSKRYARFKHNLKRGVAALPFFGDKLVGMFERTRDNLKSIILSNKLFENFGIKYYGPFDGHNIKNTIEIFKQVKNENRPVLIHLVTNKGNGYEIAETDAEKFHGLSPKSEGQTYCFSEIVGSKLCEMAKTDKRVVAVTAAMKSGTGLEKFFEQFPERAFDVAIAEQHAVTMAAGMAKGGLKPYFAVYSSFLQRGFDQIVHDVCYDNLPVTFLIDRAGAVGADGITHQGILDLSYLGMIPNMTVLAPKDGDELEDMLEFSLTCDSPLAIRYPKSFTAKYEKNTLASVTEWETIKESDKNKYILAVGNRALDAAAAVDDVNVINARCVKPLDTKLLSKIGNGSVVLTLEDNVVSGGFGASVLEYFSKENANVKVISLGYNGFVDDMNTESSLRTAGLCGENIKKLLK